MCQLIESNPVHPSNQEIVTALAEKGLEYLSVCIPGLVKNEITEAMQDHLMLAACYSGISIAQDKHQPAAYTQLSADNGPPHPSRKSLRPAFGGVHGIIS